MAPRAAAPARPDLRHERAAGYPRLGVAGVDEVGRGPLAGPVMAAAVILPAAGLAPELEVLVDDSKRVARAARPAIAARLADSCAVGLGRADVAEIDADGLTVAVDRAMRRAIAALPVLPDAVLIDGRRVPADLGLQATPVVKGDRLCLSIAAASIVAKVARDAAMCRLAVTFPGYGWDRNAGYPTVEHRAALRRLGVTPHHRRSFAPVALCLADQAQTKGEESSITI